MAQRAQAWPRTADDLDDIPPDGKRYEIIDGELYVSAAPSIQHQLMVSALSATLRPHAASLGLAMLTAPLDVRASSLTQVEPDLLALPRALAIGLLTRWAPMSALVLAIEVLSPSTARVDRGRKRELYMAEGVDQYWIVDIEAQTVEVWVPSATAPVQFTAADVLHWQPLPDTTPLVIELDGLFREVI